MYERISTKKFKSTFSVALIALGFIGIFLTYSFHDSRSYYNTQQHNSLKWNQGGVSVDSAADGTAAGLGVASGLLILSGTLLLSKID